MITRAISFAFVAIVMAAHVSAGERLPMSAAQQQALGIVTQLPQAGAAAAGRSWSGRVAFAPDAEWMVMAQLTGTLSRWLVAPGQSVKRGEVLAWLQSDAALDLQRDYLAAVAQLEVETAARQRDEALFGAGIIAEKRWQETRQRWQSQRLGANALMQRLRLAGFDAETLQHLRATQQVHAEYPLRAPADAVVAERLGTLGQRVESMAPVLKLGDVNKRWIYFRVPAADVNALAVGDVVITEAGARAALRHVSRVIDPLTQTAEAQAEVGEGDAAIGELVQVRKLTAEAGLLIPASAVVQHNNRDVVFVADGDGFVVRPVRISGGGKDHVVVLDNLKADERIAVSGLAALKGKLLGLGEGS
jgi:RND family efflux transporter MFP subunit